MSEHGINGNQSGKPEWFSLVEADTRIQHNPRDRGLRIMALAGPLLVISTGLLFAQTNGGHDASAIESTSVNAPATPGTSELASSQPVAAETVVSSAVAEPASASPMKVSSQAPSVTLATPSNPVSPEPTLANPGVNQGFVAPAPSTTQSLSDDDEDDEYEGEDEDEGDEYEDEADDEGEDEDD